MRIAVLPLQPHCFAFGGFEVQMLDAIEAIEEHGTDIFKLDVWGRDQRFDVLHVWGLEFSHLPAIDWALRAGKAVVMTALLPYWSVRWWARYRMPGSSMRLKRRAANNATHLVVVNEAQRRAARRYFNARSINIIPNIVAEEFFLINETVSQAGVAPLLCVGNICNRKNQVGLARACIDLGYQIRFIGEVVPGEERYAEELARLASLNEYISWDTGIEPRSLHLQAAYAGCKAFALASFSETQPISALEALAARKRILLADRPYARESLFSSAILVEPSDRKSIAAGLTTLMKDRQGPEAIASSVAACRANAVAKAYISVYEEALSRIPGKSGMS